MRQPARAATPVVNPVEVRIEARREVFIALNDRATLSCLGAIAA
jgi:hypothetical protein